MAKKSFKKPNYKSAVSRNVEKQRLEGRSYGYMNLPNGVDLFKESKETLNKKGRVLLDIIPYVISNKHHADLDPEVGIEVGSLWYKTPFKVHRSIGAGDGETVVCPTTFGLPCPICELRKKRMIEGAEKEEIKALAPSKRNLYAIIPIGVKDVDEKIHIWNTSDFFVQEMINKELEENEDMACFPDLEDGFSLDFRFDEESYKGKPYFKPSRLDFEERDAYDESILDDVPDLDKCLKVLSYKELTALLYQIEPEDVEEDEDEEVVEKPTRRRKSVEVDDEEEEKPKPTRRRKAEPEPEEEEVDIPDAEEDDELPEGYEVCPNCGGTGMTKRGRKCPTCDGEGIVLIEEEEDELEQKVVEKPTRKKNSPRAEKFVADAKKRGAKGLDDEEDEKPTAKAGKGKCPFGHTFGEDNDAFPKDCKKCDVWDECFDAM